MAPDSFGIAFWSYIIISTSILSCNGLIVEKELGVGKRVDFTSHVNYKLLPPLETCGTTRINKRPKRVVGGRPTPISKLPWMAQLYLFNVTGLHNNMNCGGTFITDNVILTAAHCLTRMNVATTFLEVGFGQSDRRKIKLCDYWERETEINMKKCSKKFTRGIKKTIVHEMYSEGNLKYDIALIFLDRPVKFSSRVRPICLPYSDDLWVGWDDKKVKVAGWGMNTLWNVHGAGERDTSKFLLEADVNVKERNYCDEYLARQYGRVEEDRICLIGETGVASCAGDSGGPIYKKLRVPILEKEGREERTFQIGMTSSGTGACGYQGRPKLSPNILYLMPWILDNLSQNSSLNSAESFSSEVVPKSSKDSSSEIATPISTRSNDIEYKNEFSTGLDIDVISHPNLAKLPGPDECGSIPPKAKKPKYIDSEDYDVDIKLDYDEDLEKEKMKKKLKHSHSKKLKSFKASKASKVIHRNGKQKHRQRFRPKRLVGGRIAGLGWYPFMAQIYVRDTTAGDSNLRCSGMIITKNIILTAADCVTNIPAPWALDFIRVGNYNRNKTEECIDGECFVSKTLGILKVTVHEGYTKYTHHNNIALLKLGEDLKFNRVIQPICLPTSESFLNKLNATWMIATGWGGVAPEKQSTNKFNPSNIPKYIEVEIKPRSFCDRVYTRSFGILERDRVCGISSPGSGECDGDGGGPLMKAFSGKLKGKMVRKYVQFGIISILDCGEGMPTVYTNILFFMPWIFENL